MADLFSMEKPPLLLTAQVSKVATVGKGANGQNTKFIQWGKVVVKCLENVYI